MTVKQCKLDALIERMWRQAEAKGYAELNPDDVISLAELKAERDSLRGKMELINGLIGVSERVNTLAEQRLDELNKQVVSLAVELSAVEAIHTECVFITDEIYEQCPPEVQKVIRSLAVMQMPSAKEAIANWQAQGVEEFAEYLLCPDLDETIRAFADQLRKGASNDQITRSATQIPDI